MKMLAWGWSLLMLCAAALLAAQGDALGVNPPPNLILGLVFSAAVVLPPLWDRDSGMLGELGAPGLGRVALAALLPLFCGMAGTPFGADAFMRA